MPSRVKLILSALGAVICFHLANAGLGLGILILGFLFCLLQLAEIKSFSLTFWVGLGVGILIYVPPLYFFKDIFGLFAISLWFILCGWLLAFLLLARSVKLRWGRVAYACAAPFLWTGLEYFRGELYPLRFTWLSAGYAFSDSPQLPLVAGWGVYGIGFVLTAAAAVLYGLPVKRKIIFGAVMAAVLLIPFPQTTAPMAEKILQVAGVQLEAPSEAMVLHALTETAQHHPEAEVLVLSEYTFHEPVPDEVKAWCREHQKYLVIGAIDPVNDQQFYDTAFVVGPAGKIVFQQAKCVPVQFFQDGLPAREQNVWDSPWGKIGMGICYDASYRRVVDELVRQGAQALIFPTMDVQDWGAQEHRLNSLVAPMRAAEYRLPLFRLASSGISEIIESNGEVQTRASFPGQNEEIAGTLALRADGRLPLDYWLAPLATGITLIIIIWLVGCQANAHFRRKK